MADKFDPASVPIRPAATVMLIRETPALEVFMMRDTQKPYSPEECGYSLVERWTPPTLN